MTNSLMRQGFGWESIRYIISRVLGRLTTYPKSGLTRPIPAIAPRFEMPSVLPYALP